MIRILPAALVPLASVLLASGIGAAPALAQSKPAETTDTRDPIVVTGVRLEDSEKALQDCIARHCPPDKDIAATLRHAENQFVAGRYKDARTTLLASRGRNKRFGKQYPVPVSDLLRANSRVAAHLGEGEAYRIGAYDVVSTLKAGLPADDPRILVAQIEVGDSFARFDRPDAAEDSYRAVARRAHALGYTNVEGYALLRIASLFSQYSQRNPGNYKAPALRALNDLIDTPDPKLKPYGKAAQVLKARLLMKGGDSSAVDALIAAYRTEQPTTKPVLLFAPTIKTTEMSDRAFNSGEQIGRIANKDFDDQWVDISFWVAPDGRVTDAGVLRQSEHLSGGWAKPIVEAISGRRYAPLALDPSDPGVLRVERYTFTSRWTYQTGSRVRVRDPIPQIEVLDLSADAPAAKAG